MFDAGQTKICQSDEKRRGNKVFRQACERQNVTEAPLHSAN
jgi:hypothetical protein